MPHDHNTHPVTELHQSSQTLKEQTLFAHRQAATGANNARQVGAELAALDLEKAFQQLRQMVALVGGKSATSSEDNVVTFLDRAALSHAAE